MKQPRYDAFISYRWKSDLKFARRVHRRLENIRTTSADGVRRRLIVFRDENELQAGGDLPKALRDAICLSDCFVVLCSKDTPLSEYVNREVEEALSTLGNERVVPVMREGKPPNIFPQAFLSRGIVPVAIDFRPRAGEESWLESRRRIRTEWFKLQAAVLNVPVDQIAQRHLRQSRHRAISIALTFFFLSLVWSSWQVFLHSNAGIRWSLRRAILSNVMTYSRELQNYNYVLKECAVALGGVGDTAGVKMLADGADGKYSSCQILSLAAKGASSAGIDTDVIDRLFNLAEHAERDFHKEKNIERDLTLRTFAEALWFSGRTTLAKTKANDIRDPYTKVRTLLTFAEDLSSSISIRKDLPDSMYAAANRISNKLNRCRALGWASTWEMQLRPERKLYERYFSEMKATISDISGSEDRARALASLSVTAAAVDRFDEAFQIVRSIDDTTFLGIRYGVLRDVARYLIQKNQIDQAIILIPKIDDDYFKSDLLSSVVQGYIEWNQFDQAREFARKIPSLEIKAQAFAHMLEHTLHDSIFADSASSLRQEGMLAVGKIRPGLYKVRALAQFGEFGEAWRIIQNIGTLEERVISQAELLKEIGVGVRKKSHSNELQRLHN